MGDGGSNGVCNMLDLEHETANERAARQGQLLLPMRENQPVLRQADMGESDAVR